MDNLPRELLSLQEEAGNELTSSDRLTELATDSNELARQVALNPSTPPEVLQKLAHSSDATTRQHVAANPNTPTDVLLSLGSEFPEALLDNPIFSLLLLENPNLVHEIPLSTLRSLLKCETVPVSLLEQAANNSDMAVQLAVATNVHTPQTVLAKLMHNYGEVSNAAQLHVTLAGEMTSGWHEAALKAIKTTDFTFSPYLNTEFKPEQCIEQLEKRGLVPKFVIEQLAKHEHKSIRQLIARNPNLPVNLLEQLAQDGDKEVRRNVAANPKTPVPFLERLAQDGDKEVRRNVAANPKTSAQFLEQLALDGDKEVRRDLAKNPNIPIQLLEKLARDSDDAVRECVASNRNTPDWLLKRLARDDDDFVRQSVASNPKTPVRFLKHLVWDDFDFTRWAVASNPSTPVQFLEQLARDSDRSFRGYVAQNPNIPIQLLEQLAQDSDPEVRMSVAQNPKTPIWLLEELARDEAYFVRAFVASNSNTPVGLLEQWAQDDDSSFHAYVARNSNTPVRLLEQLARHEDCVRRFILQNPRTPVKLFLELILKFYTHSFTPSVIRFLVVSPCLVRFLVLLYPQAPAQALADNFRSLAWLERYAIAQNSNTPLSTLQALAKDGNRIVRAAARANLQASQP